MARTIPDLWRRAVEEPRPFPAFLIQEPGGWRSVSWSEAARAVEELAAGFLSLGIGKGDRVSILSRTRIEWTLCDYALASIGGVVVPIYPTSSAVECAFVLGNSGARVILCEDRGQAAKIAPARTELEALQQVIAIEGADASTPSLDEIREHGRAYLLDHPDAVEEARAAIGEEDELTIVYTSGTTGPPKGCVLTHRNYWAMVDSVRQVEGLFEPGDRALLHLPLAHTFGRLVQLLGARVGFTIAFCPDVARVAQALVDVRPTLFPSVPRVFEKVSAGMRGRLEEATGPRRRLIDWALGVGYQAGRCREEGRRCPRGVALQLLVADRLVFSKVKARFGGRLRFAISGGAPLAKEVAEFFAALGIVVLEGYGLTEGTTASNMNRPARYRFGTVGPALPGCEVKVAEDGEVLIRGETVFRGYYRDERATREVLTEDGWLKTGDIGAIDEDGFLTIADRKKDIIVTAGGKKVSPQNIENALKASRYVSEALVVGDRRPYVVALVTLDREQVEKVARTEHEIRALVQQAVDGVNRELGRSEHVRRFAILPREFEQEKAELTPTLKVRRRVCEEHFRAEIDRLYAGA